MDLVGGLRHGADTRCRKAVPAVAGDHPAGYIAVPVIRSHCASIRIIRAYTQSHKLVAQQCNHGFYRIRCNRRFSHNDRPDRLISGVSG
ncbi:hypothetical protein D3C75_660700 [compost metagenome]